MEEFDLHKDLLAMIRKYLKGEANEQETKFLETYYAQLGRNSDAELSVEESDALGAEMEQAILSKIRMEKPSRAMWRRAWYLAAAASVLLALGFLLYSNLVDKSMISEVPVVAPSDFAPGGDKAILKLADGRSIILDSASNGHLADQGSTSITKSKDGQVEYESEGSAAEEVAAQMNTISTPAGGQYRIVLPDGSKVWLNAKSEVHFPTVFAKSERRVRISGECYFEVEKDAKRPFIVNVDGKQEVIVTGTSFNVNSYGNEKAIRTTLLEGSVAVKSAGVSNTQSVMLLPGEQSAYQQGGSFEKQSVNVDEVVAWKNGLFHFSKTSLEIVMRQLERWYNVEVSYEQGVPERNFSGKIHRGANASQILEILHFAGVNFRMEASRKPGLNGRIVVTP